MTSDVEPFSKEHDVMLLGEDHISLRNAINGKGPILS